MVEAVSRTRIAGFAAALDVALVCLFVVLGRQTHAEDAGFLGFATAAWPFLAALAIGWVCSLAWRRPEGLVLPGVIVWGMTVGGGMVLRSLVGQGVQWSFIAVAALVLAAMLLGWRAVVAIVVRQRRHTTPVGAARAHRARVAGSVE